MNAETYALWLHHGPNGGIAKEAISTGRQQKNLSVLTRDLGTKKCLSTVNQEFGTKNLIMLYLGLRFEFMLCIWSMNI